MEEELVYAAWERSVAFRKTKYKCYKCGEPIKKMQVYRKVKVPKPWGYEIRYYHEECLPRLRGVWE